MRLQLVLSIGPWVRTAGAILAVCVSPTSAQSKTPDELLNQPSRPTLAEFRETYPVLPSQFPYPVTESALDATFNLQVSLMKKVPAFIAAMEYFYPGGTYAALGRDAVMVGDILDSFYRSLGQPDRVLRLNASGNSIHGMSEKVLLGFLRTSGFDLKSAVNSAPFVIFDATHYEPWESNETPGSQSTQLMRAIYRSMSAEGIQPSDALEKINVVDMKLRTKNLFFKEPFTRETYFERIRAMNAENGPGDILSLQVPELSYSQPWHGTFEKFETGQNGEVVAKPGALSPEHIRKQIINELWLMERVTAEPAFREEVRRHANRLGYRFPKGRQWQGLTPSAASANTRSVVNAKLVLQAQMTLAQFFPSGSALEATPLKGTLEQSLIHIVRQAGRGGVIDADSYLDMVEPALLLAGDLLEQGELTDQNMLSITHLIFQGLGHIESGVVKPIHERAFDLYFKYLVRLVDLKVQAPSDIPITFNFTWLLEEMVKTTAVIAGNKNAWASVAAYFNQLHQEKKISTLIHIHLAAGLTQKCPEKFRVHLNLTKSDRSAVDVELVTWAADTVSAIAAFAFSQARSIHGFPEQRILSYWVHMLGDLKRTGTVQNVFSAYLDVILPICRTAGQVSDYMVESLEMALSNFPLDRETLRTIRHSLKESGEFRILWEAAKNHASKHSSHKIPKNFFDLIQLSCEWELTAP